MAGFLLFFAWVGFGGDLAWYLSTAGTGAPHLIPGVGIITMLVAGGICWYAWTHGAKRVLWATGAREVVDPATDQERMLLNVVDEMTIAAGLPRPKVYIVPDPDPNAFATGMTPDQAAIAVTEGLLATLSRDELQGVVAHELAHVRNLDTRLMTLLAALVGAIALMSDGMGRMLRGGVRVGGGSGGRRSRGGKDGNPLAILVLVLWVITLILAPILSRILAMAVSRKREFLADATGAQFTRNPLALAEALEKLEAAGEPTRTITRGAAHLCIVDPSASQLSAREGKVADFLASHPPIRMRIARLRGMAYQAAKQSG
ncbi:MAG: M48 family metallopeptidase [Gemmatimonadales bacterium]